MGTHASASVAIVDDHPLFRCGLTTILNSTPGLTVAAEAASSEGTIKIVQTIRPDLLIIDLDIPGGGLNVLNYVTSVAPDIKCVILTICDNPHTAVAALNAGAKGYILKGIGAAELRDALFMILKNHSYVSPAFARAMLLSTQTPHHQQDAAAGHFTGREKEVLRHLEHGRSNKEIARALHLTERTIKFYMSNIIQKLGVRNRVEVAMWYQNARNLNGPNRVRAVR